MHERIRGEIWEEFGESPGIRTVPTLTGWPVPFCLPCFHHGVSVIHCCGCCLRTMAGMTLDPGCIPDLSPGFQSPEHIHTVSWRTFRLSVLKIVSPPSVDLSKALTLQYSCSSPQVTPCELTCPVLWLRPSHLGNLLLGSAPPAWSYPLSSIQVPATALDFPSPPSPLPICQASLCAPLPFPGAPPYCPLRAHRATSGPKQNQKERRFWWTESMEALENLPAVWST